MDRPAENRRASSLGGDRRHPRCDGLLQLGGSPGEPQSADVVALSRTPPFPGGHERPDGLSHAPLDPRLLSLGIDSGSGPPFERCTVGHRVDPLRRDGCLCALQHTCELRAPGAGFCESQLSQDPSQVGWAAGRQPRLRIDRLGSDVPSSRLPHGRDDQDRHRTAWSPAHRRAGVSATTPLLRPPQLNWWRLSGRSATSPHQPRVPLRRECRICSGRSCTTQRTLGEP